MLGLLEFLLLLEESSNEGFDLWYCEEVPLTPPSVPRVPFPLLGELILLGAVVRAGGVRLLEVAVLLCRGAI